MVRYRRWLLAVTGVISACNGEAGGGATTPESRAGSSGTATASGGAGAGGVGGGSAAGTAGDAGVPLAGTSHGGSGGATDGGASSGEAGQPGEPLPTELWSPACPGTFEPVVGVNTGFPTPTGERSFSVDVPADVSTPRPVWVPLTGSVESTNENLDARGGNRKLTADGFIVIGPARRCAGTVSGAGTAESGGACNMAGSGGWTWNPWNEGRVFGPAGEPWKADAGPDASFLQAVVKCVATKLRVDQRRVFIGGISSGGTMTNRALTFDSDFWAGGMPISGEWYATRDDGTAYGAGGNEFAARRAAVAESPTKIFQGRVGPFPLKASLDPMIVITVWGGANDLWSCSGTLCADYRPSTQAGSNYFSSMPNVVHVACSGGYGHQWPTMNRDAFNRWALTTLASHPKGSPAAEFVLTPPPAGYACRVGPYTDHY